ncbi:MAG TPA: hypothetical protein PKN48_10480 [Bacteroidales bacterium]|nr:hypothetical protein [Bacteroidales bacterium]
MKKTVFLLTLMFIFTYAVFSQNTKGHAEVLYFKTDISVSIDYTAECNLLESTIENIIKKNYPQGNVIFKEIRLAVDSNKVLVDKYQARSQTVVIVKKKKKKEKSVNVEGIIQNYLRSRNDETLEKDLVKKINKFLNKKS